MGLVDAADEGRLIDPPPPPYGSLYEGVSDWLSALTVCWTKERGKPGSGGQRHKRT